MKAGLFKTLLNKYIREQYQLHRDLDDRKIFQASDEQREIKDLIQSCEVIGSDGEVTFYFHKKNA